MGTNTCMTLTNGICRGCRDNVGGIKKAYFVNVCDVDSAGTFSVDTSEGFITDYTNGITWLPFVPTKHTGNYVETINISVENGTVYYNGVVTLNYTKAEQSKINTITELGKGDVAMIFMDGNNKLWWIGGISVTTTSGIPSAVTADSTNGATIGGTSFQTGTAMADANGGSLTFTIDMAHPAMEVRPTSTGKLGTDLATADSVCSGC